MTEVVEALMRGMWSQLSCFLFFHTEKDNGYPKRKVGENAGVVIFSSVRGKSPYINERLTMPR
jgi:hypothetical protein